ncbi:hypothetical protein J6590_071540 [Homalodisca vitripennis]|nr:hypothetical protein J6590_071540 [Homalodisca vitripennis]
MHNPSRHPILSGTGIEGQECGGQETLAESLNAYQSAPIVVPVEVSELSTCRTYILNFRKVRLS